MSDLLPSRVIELLPEERRRQVKTYADLTADEAILLMIKIQAKWLMARLPEPNWGVRNKS